MNLHLNKNQILGLFSIIVITAVMATGYMNNGNIYDKEAEMIRLTDLSDSDMDLIMQVKAEMYAASTSSY